jgi:hypothetical protein
MPDSVGAIILAAGGLTLSAAALWGARFLPPFAVLPLALLILVAGCYVGYMGNRPHKLRRERLSKGLCVRCGYDLTGNVNGVCPECGTRP